MEICQSEEYIGDNWWTWAVWLEGNPETLDAVQFVEWRLDPTFPDPVRRVSDRASNFKLVTGGWGVFMILASVQFKDGRREKLRHHLQLHRPDGTLNSA
jgi:transcription initiation factor IIF auxiliary subunit